MLKFITDLFKPSAPKAPQPISAETSMNFGAEEVIPFLTRVANNPRFEFATDFAKELGINVLTTPVEDTRRWRVGGSFDGHPIRLEVEAFMDDVDAPDLYFHSSQAAVLEIEQELDAFARETGK
ncbi:hypothetical protein NBRC116594_26240 [Shimia sp. NS0008-38b]|uniref:hypothetical protein n=1 Tax=Shimia sp. NS0008-38b TaxID=3127653 RepID=UPI00310C3C8F